MIDMAKTAAVSEVRAWAKSNGYDIGDRGRLPTEVWDAWAATQSTASKRGGRPSPPPAQAPDKAVDLTELKQAQERIGQLESRVERLTARLEKLQATATAQPTAPKRRFARSR